MEDDEETIKMLDHLQKYVPHLEKLISQLKDPKKKNKELQLNKLEGLLSMITDRKKKLKLDTLKKCEDVILKILQKVHPTIYKQIEQQTEQRERNNIAYNMKFLCKNPPGEFNPLGESELKTARLQAARARLNEFSTPASPSPPRDVVIAPPIVIPTEKVSRKPNPDDFMIKSWDRAFENRSPRLNTDHYKTDKPDIYRRAAESLSKKPVFERLGNRVDMSVPPLSAEDLMQLTESDNVSVSDLEHVRDDLKKKLTQEEDQNPISDLRMKLTRDRQKDHHKSPSSKPKIEKVIKDPDTNFGNLLSSIDDQILEKKEKKEDKDKRSKSDKPKDKERDKHRRKSKKRDRSKEKYKSKERKHHDKERSKEKDKDKEKRKERHSESVKKESDNDKDNKKDMVKKEGDKKEDKIVAKECKEVQVEVIEKPKEEVSEKPVFFKRLADKYNPRPRKNSIDTVDRPFESVKDIIPCVDKDSLLSTVKSSLLRNIDETLLSNVKEALLSSKEVLLRKPIEKFTASIKELKTDNDHYFTSVKDTFCPPKLVKDISVLSNQIEKFGIVKDSKKDNDHYLTSIKDTYYSPKPANEIWSPQYGMMPQNTLDFVPPSNSSRAGNTYLNTFIVQNNVNPNVPHGQYTPPATAFQNPIPTQVFRPYDPLPSPNCYEANNQVQQVDYYQRSSYQNRSYQQPYTRDRQHNDTWSNSDRQHSESSWNQHSDGWNKDPRQHSDATWNHNRQHSDNWNDPRIVARPPSTIRDPRIRFREEKESAQKVAFVPPPSQPKRQPTDDYPVYGQSRYDMMYNQDRGKKEETFTSPLNSLYTTTNDNQRTGKGYGIQNFRIPKKKVECEELLKIEETANPVDNEKVDENLSEESDGGELKIEEPPQMEEPPEPQKPVKEIVEEKEPAKASLAEQAILTDFFSDFVKNPNSKTILNAILQSMADNTVDKNKHKQILELMNSDENEKTEASVKVEVKKDIEEEEEEEEEVKEDAKTAPVEPKGKPKSKTKKKRKIIKKVRLRKSRRNKLKKLQAKKVQQQSDDVVETVGERIKNRKRVSTSEAPKGRCTELDRLHNDIKEMFICDGVLTATGKRMCRILKSDSGSEKESNTSDLPSKSKDEENGLLDSPKRRARTSNPKVLIEKTDLSKLVSVKARSDDSESEDDVPIRRRVSKRRALDLDSTPETSPSKPVGRPLSKRNRRIKLDYTEPSEEEFTRPKSPVVVMNKEEVVTPTPPPVPEKEEKEPVQEKSQEKKHWKRKRRGHNWALGVINKKVVKKKVNVQVEPEEVPEPEEVAEPEDVREPEGVQKDAEAEPEPEQYDLNYYIAPSEKIDCKLCSFKGKFIVHHYRTVHPEAEVLISRISPENAQKAIEESTENNYKDVEPVHQLEAKNRKKRFTYQCRFCQAVYKNEFAETFFDHLTSHTGEYRFQCAYCNFKTSNAKALRSHKYSSHQSSSEPTGPKPIVPSPPPNFSIVFGYLCETCNFIQMDKSSLENHIKSHAKDSAICKINMSTIISKEMELDELEKIDVEEEKEVPEAVEEPIEEVVAPVEKPKEDDPTVFKSNPDDSTENLKMEEQKHEKMLEINQTIIPKKKFSFDLLDKIKSRLDSKPVEEEIEDTLPPDGAGEEDGGGEEMDKSIENVIEPMEHFDTPEPIPATDDTINVDKAFLNKNSQPITNIIERLHGKLGVDSQPPPLIPINEFPITPKNEEIVIQVGPIAARKKHDYILFMCYMQSCMFSSTNSEEFEVHCRIFHRNKQWDGICSLCDIKPMQSEIEDAYNHLVNVHGADLGLEIKKPDPEIKAPYLRTRRLSGDMLSEQKALITMAEETPFKIVDVQTQKEESEEDDSFNFPFQIANVTTLTPEEDQALNAAVTSPSISIVAPSLVSSPISTLKVISAAGSPTTVTSSGSSLPSYNILVPFIPPLVNSSSPRPTTPHLVPLAKNVVPVQTPSPPKVAQALQKTSTSKKVVLKDVPLQAHELIAARKTKIATRILLTERKLIHLYKCPEMSCSFSTDTKRLFEVHLQQHSEFKPGMQISCLYCNFKTDFRLFAVHCDVRHGRCQFCCNYCFYRAINQSYVEMHQERDHPRFSRRVLKAPVNIDALSSQAHITLPPIKSIVPLYICGGAGCCESKFIFNTDFSNHCLTVHGGKATSCYHCSYMPSNGNDAAIHMQMHNVCYYHCRYCLYGGNTLEEVHNHLSLQHFGLMPRILERKFVSDTSYKPSSNYKWDDPKAYDRLNVLSTELQKYVTRTALIEVISYTPNHKSAIGMVKSQAQEKTDTITLYKAPPLALQKKNSAESPLREEEEAVRNLCEISKIETVSENPPIVLNNFLHSTADLLNITRSVSKLKDMDLVLDETKAVPKPVIEPKPELVNLEESIFDQAEEDISDKIVSQDPLQTAQELQSSVMESSSSGTKPLPLGLGANRLSVSYTEDELSDFMSDQNYTSVTSDDSPVKSKGLKGKGLFRCFVCQDSYETAFLFKAHMIKCVESHKSGAPRPFVCYHCRKMFKTVQSLLDHIRVHGTDRFVCSLCDYKASHQFLVRTHMKARHNIHNAIVVPVNSTKNNLDEDEFVLKPKINRQKSLEAATSKDSPNLVSETVLEFGPEDINSLPLREIYSKEVKCSVCGYRTKVRANLIRHFQFHKTGKEVPIPAIAPVNPVPCLDKNEKMFDKMFNLSLSGYKDAVRRSDKKDQPKITKEEENELPTFVPVTKRYVCGADNCDYLCLEESMLRSHLQALHSDETSYKCIHCQEVLQKGKSVINIDQIVKHFRLHDVNLYKCSYCKFLHNLKHKVDIHVVGKHPNTPPLVLIVREMDDEPEDATHAPEDIKEVKPWRCSMCKYRCSTKQEIIAHAYNKHELDTQFKCALCPYRTSMKSNYSGHFESEHPGRNVDVIDAYYEEEIVPVTKTPTDTNLFDTTPIWQRERTKLRHIRGIPIEESTKMLKKSPFKFEEKAEGKKITYPPSKKPKTLKEKKLELISKDEEDEIIEIEDDDALLIEEVPKGDEKSTIVSASASQSDQDKVGSSEYTVEDLMSMDVVTLKKAHLSGSLGPFGMPHYRQFLCPICNSFKTKKRDDIANHLYKHHDYHKFVCTICRLTGIAYNFLKRHSARKHIGLPEAIYPMTPDPKIEDWVRKVLVVQTRIMGETDNSATVSSTTVPEADKSKPKVPQKKATTEIIAADSSSTLDKPKFSHQCQHCSYSCRGAADLRKHERRHWLQKPLRCGHCDVEGVTNYEILSHSKRNHPNEEPLIVSMPTPSVPTIRPIARKRKYPKNESAITSSSDDIPAKQAVMDSDDSVSKSEDGDTEGKKGLINYRCGHCAVIGHLDLVKAHFKVAHQDFAFSAFRYQCKYCNRYFKSIDKVRAHYKFGHNDSVETCFDISDQFKGHTCEYCHTNFSQQSDLVNHHNMIHSHLKLTIPTEPPASKAAQEENLYKCSQDQCNYFSSTYAAMRDHVRVHAKPVQCGYCPQRFIYPTYVKNHLRRDHPDLEPSYHTSQTGATLYAELRNNIMVLNDKGDYQKINLRALKPKLKHLPPKKAKLSTISSPKQTARKSTTQIPVPKKPTARKSTTYIPPPPPEPDPGFSFYGNPPDMDGAETVKTIVTFNNSQLPIGFEQLKRIFDMLPTVEVTDLKHESDEL